MDPWFKDSSLGRGTRKPYLSYMSRRRKNFFENLSVTAWLIIITIAFFILALLLGFFNTADCNQSICQYIALQPQNFLFNGYIWTLLTSMFMHGGLAHLFINMFVLFSLGSLCEKIIGKLRYIWFYLAAGIFAGLAFVLLAAFFGDAGLGASIFGSPMTYAVGASGAIFAIAGLFVMLTPKLKFYIIFFPFFGLPAYIMVPLVLIITWVASSATGFPIGNTAHFGGFLAGILYGLYLRTKYKKKVRMISKMFSR